MQTYETIADAIVVARKIEAGTIDPHLGCGLLATVSEKNNSPDLLSVFELLAHQQSGHEQFGITAAATLPHIMEACCVFLAAQA